MNNAVLMCPVLLLLKSLCLRERAREVFFLFLAYTNGAVPAEFFVYLRWVTHGPESG